MHFPPTPTFLRNRIQQNNSVSKYIAEIPKAKFWNRNGYLRSLVGCFLWCMYLPNPSPEGRMWHKVNFIDWVIDWLILTTCHPGYFMTRGLGITFIVRLYLHFLLFYCCFLFCFLFVFVFVEFFVLLFFTFFCWFFFCLGGGFFFFFFFLLHTILSNKNHFKWAYLIWIRNEPGSNSNEGIFHTSQLSRKGA